MKSLSLTKGKRNPENVKRIYPLFHQGVFNHTLSEEELHEKFPKGYCELSAEIYKRHIIIPETFIVDEHYVHIYKSKGSDGTIIRAERSDDVFRNSIVLLTRSPTGLLTVPKHIYHYS